MASYEENLKYYPFEIIAWNNDGHKIAEDRAKSLSTALKEADFQVRKNKVDYVTIRNLETKAVRYVRREGHETKSSLIK